MALLDEKRIKANLSKFKACIMNIHRSNFSQEKITIKGEIENLYPPQICDYGLPLYRFLEIYMRVQWNDVMLWILVNMLLPSYMISTSEFITLDLQRRNFSTAAKRKDKK